MPYPPPPTIPRTAATWGCRVPVARKKPALPSDGPGSSGSLPQGFGRTAGEFAALFPSSFSIRSPCEPLREVGRAQILTTCAHSTDEVTEAHRRGDLPWSQSLAGGWQPASHLQNVGRRRRESTPLLSQQNSRTSLSLGALPGASKEKGAQRYGPRAPPGLCPPPQASERFHPWPPHMDHS